MPAGPGSSGREAFAQAGGNAGAPYPSSPDVPRTAIVFKQVYRKVNEGNYGKEEIRLQLNYARGDAAHYREQAKAVLADKAHKLYESGDEKWFQAKAQQADHHVALMQQLLSDPTIPEAAPYKPRTTPIPVPE